MDAKLDAKLDETRLKAAVIAMVPHISLGRVDLAARDGITAYLSASTQGGADELAGLLDQIEGEAKLGVLLAFDVHGGKRYNSYDDVPPLGLWPAGAIKYSLIMDRVNDARAAIAAMER